MIIAIGYITIGALVCYGYKWPSDKYSWKQKPPYEYPKSEDLEKNTVSAVWAGVFWPVAAPFAFAILLAKWRTNN